MDFWRPTSSKVIGRNPGKLKISPPPGLAPHRHPGSNPLPPMPDTAIHTHGQVLERLSPVLYRVALPNGKSILAHLSKRLVGENATFSPGGRVLLEFTPYDFDTARILGAAE